MEQVYLGKISSVKFGIGGYRDCMIGLELGFKFDGSSWISDTRHMEWDANLIECSKNCKWTESDRDRKYAEIMRFLSDLLNQCGVKTVEKLKGMPVEIKIENGGLKEWRILTEVI